MVEKKEQTMRFSDDEVNLLKNTFAENDELLKAIRKVFLQMPLTDHESNTLKETMRGEVSTVVRKFFLPELDGDTPLQQVVDLWMTLKIDDKDPDLVHSYIMARKILIQYIDEHLKVLCNEGKSKMELNSFKDEKDREVQFMELIARNQIISHIEQQLSQIRTLAGQKDETVDETLKRLKSNSSK